MCFTYIKLCRLIIFKQMGSLFFVLDTWLKINYFNQKFLKNIFLFSNTYPDINHVCISYVFRILIHTFFFLRKKVEFDLRPVFPAALKLIWYALFLTNKTKSINNDGRRQFDFI